MKKRKGFFVVVLTVLSFQFLGEKNLFFRLLLIPCAFVEHVQRWPFGLIFALSYTIFFPLCLVTAPGGPPRDVKADVVRARSARISWKVKILLPSPSFSSSLLLLQLSLPGIPCFADGYCLCSRLLLCAFSSFILLLLPRFPVAPFVVDQREKRKREKKEKGIKSFLSQTQSDNFCPLT